MSEHHEFRSNRNNRPYTNARWSPMTSADIKAYIALNICPQSEVRLELECHGMNDVSAPRWKRSRKAKIKTPELENWSFLWDSFHADSGLLWTGVAAKEDLVGCVSRDFLYDSADEEFDGGDCCITVVTDPKDAIVLAWVVSVD